MSLFQNEYIKGGIIGISQTVIGHPFDTIKILKQNNISIDRYLIKPKILMAGVKFPLFVSTFYNSGIFGVYSFFRKNNLSSFQSGFLSGTIMSVLLNPFEYYKIQSQVLKNNNNYKLVNNQFEYNNFKNNNKIWRGLYLTMMRESLATGIYFHNYYYLKKNNLSPFIAGGIAGCNSWILTYPIDTIKTRYQVNNNFNLRDILYQKNIYKGISFCLLRAFIVNGISFTFYDLLS